MQWLFADVLSLPFPLTDEVTWLGAAIPSFLAGLVIYSLAWAARRVVTPGAPAERVATPDS